MELPHLSLSNTLLLIYIISETSRENFAYYVFHTYPWVPASFISMMSEGSKLLLAVLFIWRDWSILPGEKNKKNNNQDLLPPTPPRQWNLDRNAFVYAIPAAFYLVNNLIYMSVLPYTSPNLLQVCILAKLPVTGILHHLAVRRQTNHYAWVSLACLSAGLLVFNFPTAWGQPQTVDSAAAATLMAPIAGGTIAVFSAMASIASERLIKAGDFWQSQVYLYSWGVILAIGSYPVMYALGLVKSHDDTTTTASSSSSSSSSLPVATQSNNHGAILGAAVLILLTASNGFLVAVMLKMKDNILKVVGTSASLVTIAMTQFLVWPALRSTNFTPLKVCGSGIVVISTWCYNFYNGKPWPMTTAAAAPTMAAAGGSAAAPEGFHAVPGCDNDVETGCRGSDEVRSENGSDDDLGEVDDVDGQGGAGEMTEAAPVVQKRAVLEPTATKVACCAMVVAFATVEIALASARDTR
ncbi:hypothetical protein VMCG_03363 [Cytospora schulzeri]|uniref:Sugar phosphate transporter domain-containing protein n=1 Tax=Cytospora schulzeri TaxID=448051 RepID=A0A423WW02_9PEZI|nr:hypothetical protein VMCG_03363 [Valsa malicola]